MKKSDKGVSSWGEEYTIYASEFEKYSQKSTDENGKEFAGYIDFEVVTFE